jgi:hypothetical protein
MDELWSRAYEISIGIRGSMGNGISPKVDACLLFGTSAHISPAWAKRLPWPPPLAFNRDAARAAYVILDQMVNLHEISGTISPRFTE